jgi:hypothetical protein
MKRVHDGLEPTPLPAFVPRARPAPAPRPGSAGGNGGGLEQVLDGILRDIFGGN